MYYLSLNNYLKETFGEKVYKLAIDGGFSCPNRDGKLGNRGCIFCSGAGSGDFASSRTLSITEQIEAAKSLVAKKITNGKYIAYFQAFTNTYADENILRSKFSEAISHPDIVAISIATRPDCLPENVLNLLQELNYIKPVWVELGLQTIHKKSADFIRRGYELEVYENAVRALKKRSIYTITHVILGLPGESREMMLDTVRYVCQESNIQVDGIKLQLLHIIDGTDLAFLYKYRNDIDNIPKNFIRLSNISPEDIELIKGYECMDLDTYARLIRNCIEIIPENIAIHRMTGDGDKKTLIAPLYSGDKKRVLNAITKELSN